MAIEKRMVDGVEIDFDTELGGAVLTDQAAPATPQPIDAKSKPILPPAEPQGTKAVEGQAPAVMPAKKQDEAVVTNTDGTPTTPEP